MIPSQPPPITAADQPFDPGLQPERTALAWRRSSMSLTIAGLVSARVLPHFWGTSGLLVGGAGVAMSLIIMIFGHRRYRTHHHRLSAGLHHRVGLPGGLLPLMFAATTVAGGLAALLLIFTI